MPGNPKILSDIDIITVATVLADDDICSPDQSARGLESNYVLDWRSTVYDSTWKEVGYPRFTFNTQDNSKELSKIRTTEGPFTDMTLLASLKQIRERLQIGLSKLRKPSDQDEMHAVYTTHVWRLYSLPSDKEVFQPPELKSLTTQNWGSLPSGLRKNIRDHVCKQYPPVKGGMMFWTFDPRTQALLDWIVEDDCQA